MMNISDAFVQRGAVDRLYAPRTTMQIRNVEDKSKHLEDPSLYLESDVAKYFWHSDSR
jgi:hypothetical protein